jgi:putative SbcD/Mre11-related phosphoesterase
MRVLGDWLLAPERVAVHLPSATAVVADLHLGYDEARRRSAEAVPVRPLDELLGPLAAALARSGVRRLVVAGDLLEDSRCQTVWQGFRAWLEQHMTELVALVRGNHDRDLESEEGEEEEGESLPARLGAWTVVHGDGRRPDGPVVQGHEHPCVRYANRVSAPCFLYTAGHLVLPAYSPDAAGVNVVGVRRWRDYRCGVIVGDRVLDFGPVAGLRRGRGPMAKRGRG